MEKTMLILRIFLFAGLVFHKLVWEVLKRDSAAPEAKPRPFKLNFKSLLKLGKSALLVLLVIQTLFLKVFPITEKPMPLRVIGTLIYVAGLAIAVTGRIQLGKNWANLEDYQVLPDQSLVHTGIYRFIRHPIYTGDIMLLLGLQLALNSWLVLGVLGLILVVVRQVLAEEQILSKSFANYSEYRKETKMFIPFLV
jgi:protein-S-isoprenylcysteine O-methyltransferase Ste14